MSSLIVAVGGGGDAITSAALPGILRLAGRPVVMTYSWDRLMIDPVPGPRSAAEFTGLRTIGGGAFEVGAETTPVSPAGSSLPRLAAELPARLVLLDPTAGAVGMAEQIRATAEQFRLDSLVLVDVGGDVLTDGDDPGLRSPLADQLALAACARSGLPGRLLIAGLGLDGEVPHDVLVTRLADLHAESLPALAAPQVDAIRHVFDWHPSEASGLLAAAASGRRGSVEVRDAGDHVVLDDSTTAIASVGLHPAVAVTPSRHLLDTGSLDEAEKLTYEITGISEIVYETKKAERRRTSTVHVPNDDDLSLIDEHARTAADRGADFISVRRLSELLGATTLDTFTELSRLLASRRPESYEPSLYRTRRNG